MARRSVDSTRPAGIELPDSLEDGQQRRGSEQVAVSAETAEHESFDHCAADIAGRTAVAVENERNEILLLCNERMGVAVLPHATVEPGDNWATTTCEEIEAVTGVAIRLDRIEALREVDHVVDPGGKPHRTTRRVVFRGSPESGEIQNCKRSAQAGSDAWEARWVSEFPEAFDAPDGGPGNDLALVFEGSTMDS